MKLIEKLHQSRRDFQGKYQCEFCNHIETDKNCNSYDDTYFHQHVIPAMKCKKCGASTFSENRTVENAKTKYSDHFQI